MFFEPMATFAFIFGLCGCSVGFCTFAITRGLDRRVKALERAQDKDAQ